MEPTSQAIARGYGVGRGQGNGVAGLDVFFHRGGRVATSSRIRKPLGTFFVKAMRSMFRGRYQITYVDRRYMKSKGFWV